MTNKDDTGSITMHFPFSHIPLEDIEEDAPMCRPLSSCTCQPPPEAPRDPMQFLSRSWSLSALEVAKAIEARRRTLLERGDKPTTDSYSEMVTAPFTFASAMTAHIVMEGILPEQRDSVPTCPRKSRRSGSVNYLVNHPRSPPSQGDDLTFCRSFSAVRNPLREISMKRWLKDAKQRRKETNRSHNAHLHAAMSVAGVAAAVAAMAAATATSTAAGNEDQSKTSMAVASAATLVAAQCVEVAESMGATRDQMSAMVSSAVKVKTPDDVLTLTAAAATALRGAATLDARRMNYPSCPATCSHRERDGDTFPSFAADSVSEDSSEAEYRCPGSLSKGCEFLKRTRKGELHWRTVFAYLNKESKVVVKSQGKYMGGTITKTKKRMVLEVLSDTPSWLERENVAGPGERRWYFGIKTDGGVMELECKSEADHRLWTDGLARLLSLSHERESSLVPQNPDSIS